MVAGLQQYEIRREPMRNVAIVLGGAALLAACQTNPPPPPAAPAAVVDPNNPLFAPGFLAQAASGDQFEIQSSQMALQMSSNPRVRNFASLLIADHTRMSQAMMAAARSAGVVPPPPAILPQHQAVLSQLSTAGPNFDVAFRDAQISGHQQALGLFQNYAASGDVPALRTAAQQAIPTMQMHLSQAQMLNVAPPAPPPPPMRPRNPGERG
jgi:putative membrane protein